MSENISYRLTAADMHWRIKSSVHWKHVNLVHGLDTFFFFKKFGLRMLVLDQNSSEFLATIHEPVCKSGPSLLVLASSKICLGVITKA